MKHITLVGIKSRFHIFLVVGAIMGVFLAGCEPEGDKLGVDIFPAGDTILIHTDTITNIETRLVRARPWVTSISPGASDAGRSFFLGSKIDSMTGVSVAEIVTQFGITQVGNFGAEPTIDSLRLYLYFHNVIGDTSQEMHITIYEFLDSLSLDSAYLSDYDITGKYDPVPLIDKIIKPKPATVYEFEFENEDFLNRIKSLITPEDSIFVYNSRLQKNFPGLYIKTETVSAGGALAKVQLAHPQSGLKFKYLHDSINEIASDTILYSTYTMSFTQFYAQKVNIFHHDFTGTPVESMLDNPSAEPQIAYVQGMSGVNVRIKLPDLASQLDFGEDDKIAINAAKLIFYVVPSSISGISEDDYPDRLMMDTQFSDGNYGPVYDYLTNTDEHYFGKLSQSNEESAFLDPLYYYSFQIGRHLQSVISKEDPIENSDLILYVDQPASNSQIIKFWSNYSAQEGGLRLELIYTKF